MQQNTYCSFKSVVNKRIAFNEVLYLFCLFCKDFSEIIIIFFYFGEIYYFCQWLYTEVNFLNFDM